MNEFKTLPYWHIREGEVYASKKSLTEWLKESIEEGAIKQHTIQAQLETLDEIINDIPVIEQNGPLWYRIILQRQIIKES